MQQRQITGRAILNSVSRDQLSVSTMSHCLMPVPRYVVDPILWWLCLWPNHVHSSISLIRHSSWKITWLQSLLVCCLTCMPRMIAHRQHHSTAIPSSISGWIRVSSVWWTLTMEYLLTIPTSSCWTTTEVVRIRVTTRHLTQLTRQHSTPSTQPFKLWRPFRDFPHQVTGSTIWVFWVCHLGHTNVGSTTRRITTSPMPQTSSASHSVISRNPYTFLCISVLAFCLLSYSFSSWEESSNLTCTQSDSRRSPSLDSSFLEFSELLWSYSARHCCSVQMVLLSHLHISLLQELL